MFFLNNITAQNECYEPSKKAKKAYQATQQKGLTNDEQYTLLIGITKKYPDFIDVYDDLVEINFRKSKNQVEPAKIKQHENIALKYCNEIIERCPSYREYYYFFKLGEYYFLQKKYTEARPYLKQFVNSGTKNKTDLEKAANYLNEVETYFSIVENPIPFNPQKVKGASTEMDEYLPMLSPDNRYLFYTRSIKKEDTKSALGKVDLEMFTQSRRMRIDSFSTGVFMSSPFNQGQYQGGVSVSVNNKILFITLAEMIPDNRPISRYPDGSAPLYANGDIYFSEQTNGEWSKLKSVGDAINGTHSWEGQPSVSSDNKTLYFVRYFPQPADAKNKEHYGGMDIYKSERLSNGAWGEPINLGSVINTEYDEKSPFIHSDSYTLYFSSNGHIGMGGQDIYYSKIDENTMKFTKPVNIGYPINTEKDEHGFIVSTDGKRGYFASNIDGSSIDIYSFEIPEKARPEKVLFVEGEITNEKGEVPANVTIELKNTETGKITEGVIDNETGKYVAVVSVKKEEEVLLTAKKEGYAFSSQLVSSGLDVVGKPQLRPKLEVQPIEVGKAYRINDINFETNSYELNHRAKIVIDEFVDFLKLNPKIKIAIQGHTDDVGKAEDNMALSHNRARVVYEYIIEKGINSQRLSYKGFGKTVPLVPNTNEINRAKNRRTEFLIVEK
ncbi:MAG: cell envelope biogenesis protein OmpA [Bacteroidota bacterium]|nr:MAG: cell envelope biogenesis protein OmpA [Bacteroidota bacterium]